MKTDAWWLTAAEQPGREKRMRSRLIREILGSLVQVPKPLQTFYAEVMRRKIDDITPLIVTESISFSIY